jgi:uncharacterized protein YheU (UPF0270 family)
MIIPHSRLSSDALAGVIEEYVTRDGTEVSEGKVKATAGAKNATASGRDHGKRPASTSSMKRIRPSK